MGPKLMIHARAPISEERAIMLEIWHLCKQKEIMPPQAVIDYLGGDENDSEYQTCVHYLTESDFKKSEIETNQSQIIIDLHRDELPTGFKSIKIFLDKREISKMG